MQCPHCHSTQLEPRISLSTFCKSCGQHIKIEDAKAVVSPSAQQIKTLSPTAIVREVKGHLEPTPPEAKRTSPSLPKPEPAKPFALSSRVSPLGSKIQEEPARPDSADKAPTTRGLAPAAPPRPAYESSQSARSRVTSSPLGNRHKPRNVVCFECGHEHEVTYAAKTARCPECRAEINIGDYEINKPLCDDISTRGSVTINNLGALICAKLTCHNLKAYGQLTAAVECTGDVMIRNETHIVGDLICQRLIVGRDASVIVDGDVKATEMEIGGPVTAQTFECQGNVLIDEGGAVNGPLKTRSISMEPGGSLNGTLQILQSSRPKKAKASSPPKASEVEP